MRTPPKVKIKSLKPPLNVGCSEDHKSPLLHCFRWDLDQSINSKGPNKLHFSTKTQWLRAEFCS